MSDEQRILNLMEAAEDYLLGLSFMWRNMAPIGKPQRDIARAKLVEAVLDVIAASKRKGP